MNHNLFLVDSPLQALCAVEIALSKSADRNDLICGLSGGSRQLSDRQIEDICALGEWRELLRYDVSKNRGKLARFLGEFNFLKFANRTFKGEVDTLYIGDFRSQWMHYCRASINPTCTSLIDDGASTLNVVSRFFKKGCFSPETMRTKRFGFTAAAKSLAYFRLVDMTQLEAPVRVITSFDLDRLDYPDAEALTFEHIRSRLRQPDEANGDAGRSQVFYFGSKYSEAGIVALDYELKFLRQIKKHYDAKGMELLYHPHRDETRAKLDLIRERLGVKVVSVKEIAEVYLLKLPSLPQEIASAYSTVLNSCALLFPSVSKTSFRLASDRVDPVQRRNVESVYSYYQALGIPVIDPECVKKQFA